MQERSNAHPTVRGALLAILLGLTLACAATATANGAKRPSFSFRPADSSEVGFSWRTSDYAVRCGPHRVKIAVQGAKGWETAINAGPFVRGGFTKRLTSREGKSTEVTFRRGAKRRQFHIRCLPEDFPGYGFKRSRPGGPEYFLLQLGGRYLAIVDDNGVPVWWFKATGEPDNAQLLPDGTLAWDPVDQITFQTGDYEIHSLKGRLIRTVHGGGGKPADIHEIQLLPNGNYLIGAQTKRHHVDASPYGGSADATVIDIQLQEITPGGKVVWRWNSADHIGLEETGRWWDNPILDDQPYDIVHWNAADPRGKYMLLSFRHLDAVYEINRKTGEIVWKLGGTKTPESLSVIGDPHGDHPLGGQHDARFLSGRRISVHDNRTGLGDPPRAVVYKIDAAAGTARLAEAIADPKVTDSICCGSARRLEDGDWLIDWGGNGLIGAYDGRGRNLFRFRLDVGFSYRANPVPDGALTDRRLRRAMDAMSR